MAGVFFLKCFFNIGRIGVEAARRCPFWDQLKGFPCKINYRMVLLGQFFVAELTKLSEKKFCRRHTIYRRVFGESTRPVEFHPVYHRLKGCRQPWRQLKTLWNSKAGNDVRPPKGLGEFDSIRIFITTHLPIALAKFDRPREYSGGSFNPIIRSRFSEA